MVYRLFARPVMRKPSQSKLILSRSVLKRTSSPEHAHARRRRDFARATLTSTLPGLSGQIVCERCRATFTVQKPLRLETCQIWMVARLERPSELAGHSNHQKAHSMRINVVPKAPVWFEHRKHAQSKQWIWILYTGIHWPSWHLWVFLAAITTRLINKSQRCPNHFFSFCCCPAHHTNTRKQKYYAHSVTFQLCTGVSSCSRFFPADIL